MRCWVELLAFWGWLAEQAKMMVEDSAVSPPHYEAESEQEKRLDFDHIPIERHWGLSILLHNALGHTEPWEICEDGCDRLAFDAIRELFGLMPPAPVHREEGKG